MKWKASRWLISWKTAPQLWSVEAAKADATRLEEAAIESDRQLRDVRNELGCSEAALTVAREAHATAAQQLTAAKDEAAAMRDELQAATEELGGGTVEMLQD